MIIARRGNSPWWARFRKIRFSADGADQNSILFETVLNDELRGIEQRRITLNKRFEKFGANEKLPDIPTPPSPGAHSNNGDINPTPLLDVVGLGLSGGGIRSASFCLGVLQALDANTYSEVKKRHSSDDTGSATSLIHRIDYLSTVSGGGYIGTSLTAALSKRNGDFPFEARRDQGETRSVQHIRDYSNYLFPRGFIDIIDSVALYMRGLIINLVMIMSVVLFAVLLTLLFNPDKASLLKADFTLTIFLSVLLAMAFAIWGLASSLWDLVSRFSLVRMFGRAAKWVIKGIRKKIPRLRRSGATYTTGGRLTRGYGFALILLLAVAFCQLQPVLLSELTKEARLETFTASVIQRVLSIWALLAAVVAFFAGQMERFIKLGGDMTKIRTRVATAISKATIIAASAALPLLIWLVYLKLSIWGIQNQPPALWSQFLNFILSTEFTKLAQSIPFIDSVKAVSTIAASLLSWIQNAARNARLYVPTVMLFYVWTLLILLFWVLIVRPNKNSLHRLYRDRLSRAFVFVFDPKNPLSDLPLVRTLKTWATRYLPAAMFSKRARTADKEPVYLNSFRLSELSDQYAPQHIINAALNIQASNYVNRRGRNADFFMFSKRYVGSDATKYARTEEMEDIDPDLNLATAMAISGAAASSNMGSSTVRPLTPTLTILNVSLGYWLRNPSWKVLSSTLHRWVLWLHEWFNWFFYLELLGRLHEKSWSVYLTDGGHIENLGLYTLLRRRCRLIIAVDAEYDPKMNFNSFVKLQRYARIDLGVRIDLPWQGIRNISLATNSKMTQLPGELPVLNQTGPHCAIGRITYPNDDRKDDEGYLVYIKSSLTGDEIDYVLDYKRRYPNYPHESTSDQLFTEEQLEVYRALGFHIAAGLFNGRDRALMYRHDGQIDAATIFSPLAATRAIRSLLGIIRRRRAG